MVGAARLRLPGAAQADPAGLTAGGRSGRRYFVNTQMTKAIRLNEACSAMFVQSERV